MTIHGLCLTHVEERQFWFVGRPDEENRMLCRKRTILLYLLVRRTEARTRRIECWACCIFLSALVPFVASFCSRRSARLQNRPGTALGARPTATTALGARPGTAGDVRPGTALGLFRTFPAGNGAASSSSCAAAASTTEADTSMIGSTPASGSACGPAVDPVETTEGIFSLIAITWAIFAYRERGTVFSGWSS